MAGRYRRQEETASGMDLERKAERSAGDHQKSELMDHGKLKDKMVKKGTQMLSTTASDKDLGSRSAGGDIRKQQVTKRCTGHTDTYRGSYWKEVGRW